MLLQGKKIGFVLTINQVGNTIILQEIKKILFAGAEVFIILLDPAGKKEEIVERLQDIFAPALTEGRERIVKNKAATLTGPDNASCLPQQPFLDLLVLVPDSEVLLGCLEQITAENSPHPPLVLITALENIPALPLSRISSLMKKNEIFFVPFGPIEQKQEMIEKKSILYSRMDLLTETCAAALEGHQLKPSIWEDLSFPH